MLHPMIQEPGQKTLSENPHLFRELPAPPANIIDLANVKPGAPSPVRAKFLTGFNCAVRHVRYKLPKLEGVHRADRSPAFLAGYELGLVHGKGLQTTQEIVSKCDECFRMWGSTHHAISTTVNLEAAEAIQKTRPDFTEEQRMAGGSDGTIVPDDAND